MQHTNLGALSAPIAPAALAKSVQIAAKNTAIVDLLVDNKGGSDFFVQVWDVADVGDIGGADADAAPDFEEKVLAGGFCSWTYQNGYQFHRGLYIRAVTAYGGSTLITTAAMKVSGRILTPYPICS